jgi:hypothetical protein
MTIGNIGFVLNDYHTELLEFLFELTYDKYNLILYIENDSYNNLELLKTKYKFTEKSLLNYLDEDYKKNVCFKYIILSHLDVILQYNYFKSNCSKFIFLVHNDDQMTHLKNNLTNFEYFVVSNQLNGDCMIPLTNNSTLRLFQNYNNITDINIIKIGWIVDCDESIYDKILSLKNVKLRIFTKDSSPNLERLLSKYNNVYVEYAKSTKYIHEFILKNNVKFVLHIPNSIGIWSGSISMALDNNLILLTNNEVISNYNIPSEYCLSYESNLEENLYNKYNIDNRDESILQTYRNQITFNNLCILDNKLKSRFERFNLNINNQIVEFNGDAYQDLFVIKANDYKSCGYFIEIGSAWPKHKNNSYSLEKYFDWKGIMIEYDNKYLESYKLERPNSIHVINDATEIDYLQLFEKNNVPLNVDYLQIDLEVDNESTLKVIKLFDKYIFDKYKFATITFEHDFYRGDFYNTRYISRNILHRRGYVLLFPDVGLGPGTEFGSFEDWWVHPDLVDEEFIKKNYNNYNPIICDEIIQKMF